MKNMNEKLTQHLDEYSKLRFQNNLGSLEDDVNRRLRQRKPDWFDMKAVAEGLISPPKLLRASAIAFSLVSGLYLGMSAGLHPAPDSRDALGFEVFSVENANFPSSLLAKAS